MKYTRKCQCCGNMFTQELTPLVPGVEEDGYYPEYKECPECEEDGYYPEYKECPECEDEIEELSGNKDPGYIRHINEDGGAER